jgi:hypothetical protein
MRAWISHDHEGVSAWPWIHDHGEVWQPGGLRHKSETADHASTAPRQLIIEWITLL